MKLAIFDFDGTITKSDSFRGFIIFYHGYHRFILGVLATLPSLVLYWLNLISNSNMKQRVITHFFEGESANKFRDLAEKYSNNKIGNIIRDEAIDKINWHKNNKDEVVIVSASIDMWLKPWCDKNSIKLISTEVEIKENKITGKLIGRNCWGPEKVKRIKSLYNLEEYSEIHVYGDSRGDKEMLELADESYFKPFRD